MFFISKKIFQLGVTLSIASCATLELAQVCEKQIPRFFTDVAQVNQSLIEGAGQTIGQDRRIASSLPLEPILLEVDQREDWEDWAKSKLDHTQDLLDLLARYPRLDTHRTEFSQIANDLVIFHGYASRGESDKMSLSLSKILTQRSTLEGDLCRRVSRGEQGPSRY